MNQLDPFDPPTPEQLAQRQQDEDIARRVRREVLRMQSGEADEDIRAELEAQEAEKHEDEQQRIKEELRAQRQQKGLWPWITGTVLTGRHVAGNYHFMVAIACMFFVSILVFFTALHLDRKYSTIVRQTQILRERSIRLQEKRYRTTTHSSIVEQLRVRSIELRDPLTPGQKIEN